MKFINNYKKYKYEIFAFLLLMALALILSFFATQKEMNAFLRDTLFFGFIFDIVSLYLVLRKLWREKWRKKFIVTTKKIFSAIAKKLFRLLDKIRTINGEKTNILSGKTVVSFDFSFLDVETKKQRKILKWKHMKTDRERLGFLYNQMITKKILKGDKIIPSNTPLELEKSCKNDDYEIEIFKMYIEFRYDERKDVVLQKNLYSNNMKFHQ